MPTWKNKTNPNYVWSWVWLHVSVIPELKKLRQGAEEMVQPLRTLAAPSQDLGSVSQQPHGGWQLYLQSQRIWCPLLAPDMHCATQADMQTKHTYKVKSILKNESLKMVSQSVENAQTQIQINK